MNWDTLYMLLAGDISFKSKDPRTKVGAVAVNKKKRVVSIGFNGFPRNVIDSVNVYEDRKRKWYRVIHAETNAIVFAGGKKIHTMYCTHPPCGPCMALMIQAGVKEAVWDSGVYRGLLSYEESHKEALEMAWEAGLKMFEWNGKERVQIENPDQDR